MSATNPQVTIIADPKGAGKSTLAPYLLKDTFGLLEYVNADTIALGLSAFSPERVAFRAGRIMLERLHSLAEAGASFAFESTLATRSYVPWIRELKGRGYGFHLIYLWLRKPELAVERVKERVRLGGHDVPEVTILRRYRRGCVTSSRCLCPWPTRGRSTIIPRQVIRSRSRLARRMVM